MFVAREITAEELELVPGGSVVFRMDPRAGRPHPMHKWDQGNLWAVLGEYDEGQSSAIVGLGSPGTRFVLIWEGEVDDGGDRWQQYVASSGPW